MRNRHLIKTEALIIGYALARLGPTLLNKLNWQTSNEAFAKIADCLDEKHNSIKNLRDEFDVFFPNGRRGWINRAPHPSRIAVLHEFEGVSDIALIELAQRILAGDKSAIEEIAGHIEEPPKRVANVAERLLTGRLAEDHFISNCEEIIKMPYTEIRDTRHNACGYDFELPGLFDPSKYAVVQSVRISSNKFLTETTIAIEVKGLKKSSGGILFTDLEWNVAMQRRTNYWLILIGNLDKDSTGLPAARIVPDPVGHFGDSAKCDLIVSRSAQWRMQASLQ